MSYLVLSLCGLRLVLGVRDAEDVGGDVRYGVFCMGDVNFCW